MTYLSLWVDDPLMVLNAAMRPWTVMRKKRRWRRFVTSILFSTFFFSLLATISLLPWLMSAILGSLVTCFSSLSLPVPITFTSCVYHFHFLCLSLPVSITFISSSSLGLSVYHQSLSVLHHFHFCFPCFVAQFLPSVWYLVTPPHMLLMLAFLCLGCYYFWIE